MKKFSKISTATLLFIAIFTASLLGTYTLLNNYDLSSTKDIKTQLLTLKENMPRAYVVQSGSMEPVIPTGALIFSLPQKNYRSGDVLTFKSGNRLITHRAMYQEYTLEDSFFTTKGDANEEVDANRVSKSQVVGKVVFSVPYIGYLADYAKTPKGFILFVIVPATIVIYEELKSLMKELLKFIRRMKKHNPLHLPLQKREGKEDSPSLVKRRSGGVRNMESANSNPLSLPLNLRGRTNEENSNEENHDYGSFGSKLIKGMAILPIFGAILVVAAFSVSYFFDNESSLQNVFSASSDFGNNETPTPTPDPNASPTPTPGNNPFDGLVINEVLPDTECAVGNTEAQWIEIYNGTGQTVNPKDFMITDGTNIVDLVTANNLSITPGGLLLLAHNSAIWGTNNNNCWDDNGVQTGNLGGQLNIDVGVLQLVDPGADSGTSDDVVIDTVRWGAGETHQPAIDESIERDPLGEDNAFGVNFDAGDFVVHDPPTPGS